MGAENRSDRHRRLCSKFSKELGAGSHPAIARYEQKVPEAEWPELLAELIREEHSSRRKAGELPTLDEYIKRFRGRKAQVQAAFFTTPDDGGERHALVRELGKGGQATVYLAHDNEHDEDVAIKVLHQSTLPTTLGRFKQEAHLLKKCKHPLIVPILEHFEQGERLFIVLEFIPGQPLAKKLAADGKMAAIEAARLVAQVADAVDHVHTQSETKGSAIVHRDIKPGNIIVDDQGQPLVGRNPFEAVVRYADNAGISREIAQQPFHRLGRCS
jgi:hypothetical protein